MTGWTTRETAEKCGLSQHTLRWHERIGPLDRVARTPDGRRRDNDAGLDWILREHVQQALRQQQEYLDLLDHKISAYERRLRAARPGTGQE